MLKLDNNLLEELGLGSLPEDQKKAMLQHIYDTLELRVGTQLANQMTDQQLQEFEQFIDAGGDASQAQALQWLEANLPNYKQVVNDVFEDLKGEIKQMSAQIVSAAAQQPATPTPAADPYQQPAPAVPQYDQLQPTYAQPAPQQPMADPYQAPAPSPAPMPQPSYQQPPQPQFGQPAQAQPFTQSAQPQFTQPDPAQQLGPQPVTSQNNTAMPPYPPQQPPAGSQFPGPQPPAGPGQ